MDAKMLHYWRQGFDAFERYLERQSEQNYKEGMEEVKHQIKNIPIEGAKSDTGWIVESEGRCWTVWRRVIETDLPPSEIIKYLEQNDDYAGLDGVEFSAYKSSEGKLYFRSTLDSSD